MSETSRAGLDRRAAIAVALGAATLTAVAAAALVPWDWVPGGHLTPMPAHDLFSQAQIDRAEKFATLRRWLGWSSYAVSLLVAIALGFTSWGARLVRRVSGRLPWWATAPLGTLLLLLVGRVATFPFSLLIRRQNLDYGLTHQAFAGWLADQGRGLLVAWVTTALLVTLVVGLARRWPRRWFMWAGGLAAVLVTVGSYLYPVLVEPLFYNFTPMTQGPFRTSVFELADREGVAIDDVLVADASRRTTTLNAYVSGLWGTRRVVVYDNLLKDLTPGEARAVIAHELAHAKHEDVLLGTLLGAGAAIAGTATLALLLDARWVRSRAGISGAGDPAAVAVMLALFAVGSLVASPVSNTVSRAIEARADRDALAATGDDQAFIRMQRRLAIEAVHDPTPPRWSQIWFGSHPTALERAGLPASLRRSGG